MPTPSGLLLAAKHCELNGLLQLNGMVEMSGAISALVHHLQRERGFSNLFLGDAGVVTAAALREMAAASAEHAGRVTRRFGEVAASLEQRAEYMRLYNRLAVALAALDGLPALRTSIAERAVGPGEVIAAFSAVVSSLLAVVTEAVDSAGDPAISRLLLALFHLLQGKELSGQERATGVAILAWSEQDEERHARLARLMESSERCFEVFLEYADPASQQALLDLRASPLMMQLERLRCELLAADGARADTVAARRWFDTSSARLDSLYAIEEMLLSAIRRLCSERLRGVQADLSDHASQLSAMPQAPLSLTAVAVMLEASVLGLGTQAQPLAAALAPADVGPRLGNSIIEMLQQQSLRIEEMGQELRKARAKLDESSVVERAKGLLMARQGLSAEQAHRALRQAAMNQNRRLVDIAQAALSLVDLIPGDGARSASGRR